MRHLRLLLPFLLLAGCATRPVPVAVVAVMPTPTPTPAPFVGIGTVRVPAKLADGSYATPNRTASPIGVLWHLRAGLNVAALGCRGADEAAIIAGYNALLTQHRTEFAAAYRGLTAEYGTADRFDDAMTVLYNYYALAPARDGLCQAALAVLGEAAAAGPGTLATGAPAALARLDAPYVAVFAAQDAWLASRSPAPATAVASASVPAKIMTVVPVATPASAPTFAAPLLVADRAVLVLP